MSAGSLPAGLSLNGATGQIGGTPTQAGTSSFTLQLKDSSTPAQVTSQALTLTVAASIAPLSVTTSSLGNGQQGTAYSGALAATGGTTPYSWTISSGALPAGISLNATSGALTGTPTQSGTYFFTAKVTDSGSPALTATANLSIQVAAAIPTLQISTTGLPAGETFSAYSASVFGNRRNLTIYLERAIGRFAGWAVAGVDGADQRNANAERDVHVYPAGKRFRFARTDRVQGLQHRRIAQWRTPAGDYRFVARWTGRKLLLLIAGGNRRNSALYMVRAVGQPASRIDVERIGDFRHADTIRHVQFHAAGKGLEPHTADSYEGFFDCGRSSDSAGNDLYDIPLVGPS